MNQALEQTLQVDIANNVSLFCRHPIIDILEPSLNKHTEYQVKLKTFCRSKSFSDRSPKFDFALYSVLGRKIKRGAKHGRSIMAIVSENNHMIHKYD